MNIGIAGTGRMGSAIAQRLLECGHAVAVWNRTPEKTKAAQAAGARVAGSAAELATGSEAVITILTNAGAIDSVYRGAQGLLAGQVKGKLFIEMSTVRPETERSLAAGIAAKGAHMVECPVGGTVGPAREGKLLGLAGADDAAFERARPLLDQMCRRVERCGPVGAGASMKLAVNLPLIVFWEAFGEAMALARPLGFDAARLVELFTETAGGANVLKNRAALVAKALAGEDTGPATFDLDSMRKDLRTMLEEARSRGFELPAATGVLAAFDQAAAAGQGGIDGVRIPAYVVKRSGVS
ncbi:MAG TPA: NAD(P)-dependent oxidoreductase [Burkholderiales bacterium]|nr:NAD(P)-dependent oxidoreductase [Burkholderiales bacterium]